MQLDTLAQSKHNWGKNMGTRLIFTSQSSSTSFLPKLPPFSTFPQSTYYTFFFFSGMIIIFFNYKNQIYYNYKNQIYYNFQAYYMVILN